MKTLIIISCLLVTAIISLDGQNIKRRGSLGLTTGTVSDSLAVSCAMDKPAGVVITGISNQFFAKKTGLKTGDIILKLNGTLLESPSSYYNIVKKFRENDKVTMEIRSGKKTKTLTAVTPPLPFESSDDYDIIYDEVPFDEGWVRTITGKPRKEGKMPAILFIQGYTCHSMEQLGLHPYGQLIDGLTKKGYVVMRVEKPGEGDNTNTPSCNDIDLVTEIKAFEKGLDKLKSYDFVDTSNIFIWGHSMGGIIAPIIAAENSLKGMIIYGTGIKPWREYLVEMLRVQNPLFGVDYVENEKNMIHYYNIMHQMFVEKKTPNEIAKDTILGRLMTEVLQYDGENRLFTRNYQYMVQIDDFNLPECWAKTDAYVLSMWGNCDVEAYSQYDHREIVNVVNHYHPDHATFLKMKNTTHAFSKVESMKHGIDNYNYQYMIGNFNQDVVEETDRWIQSILVK